QKQRKRLTNINLSLVINHVDQALNRLSLPCRSGSPKFALVLPGAPLVRRGVPADWPVALALWLSLPQIIVEITSRNFHIYRLCEEQRFKKHFLSNMVSHFLLFSPISEQEHALIFCRDTRCVLPHS